MAEKLTFGRLLLAVGLITATASQINAQAQFEVASIKPLAPPYPTGSGPWTVNHGRFIAQPAIVRAVIAWAYDVTFSRVHGGPDWLDREPYDISAKAESQDAGPDQIRPMVQALLSERFKLVVHRETQEAQVYTLLVGKNGPKMQEVKNGQSAYINWTGCGRVTLTRYNMAALTALLSNPLGSPVVDQTGLKGFYNFNLEFLDPRCYRPRNGQSAIDSPPDVSAAVQEQLGLKLEAKKGSVETLTIDHVERPSEN
jgi:uncharacterized protein (TIGR03435 family)